LSEDLVWGQGKPATVRALDDEIENMNNAPAALITKRLFTFAHPNEVGLVISVKA
jgi:hypothetical protein